MLPDLPGFLEIVMSYGLGYRMTYSTASPAHAPLAT